MNEFYTENYVQVEEGSQHFSDFDQIIRTMGTLRMSVEKLPFERIREEAGYTVISLKSPTEEIDDIIRDLKNTKERYNMVQKERGN